MATSLSDEQIAKMARARVSFKIHALVYVAVNLLLMGIWMMTSDDMPMNDGGGWDAGTYWPMWTHLGWGIGLAFHGFGAYGYGSGMVKREEDKIRRQFGGP